MIRLRIPLLALLLATLACSPITRAFSPQEPGPCLQGGSSLPNGITALQSGDILYGYVVLGDNLTILNADKEEVKSFPLAVNEKITVNLDYNDGTEYRLVIKRCTKDEYSFTKQLIPPP